MNGLQSVLEANISAGKKLLLPYITGGYPVNGWTPLIEGCASVGADAVEIGIPFSDPVIDGPTIQESSSLALKSGATPQGIISEVSKIEVGIPLIAMTYYNICYRMGHIRFASELKTAGIGATILPDLSFEESESWIEDSSSVGVEHVLLAAPTSSDERLAQIAEASSGFVYGIGHVGVTGERVEIADSAGQIAKRLKQVTDKPVLVGIGVSTPEQAAEVCKVADGVIVGSAIIRRIIETNSIDSAIEFVGELREAIDKG